MYMKETKNYQLCKLLGGSHLYNLATPQSDIDYRGVYANTGVMEIFGLKKDESIQVTKDEPEGFFEKVKSFIKGKEDDTDLVYYELRKFLQMLKKANTQMLDILFAPDESFIETTPEWEYIQSNKYELFDSNYFKKSLCGYIGGEIRLIIGERTGLLGSKRKTALEKYGYSYKNYVQLRRLIATGIYFFLTGEYTVSIDDALRQELLHVKLNPEVLTKEDALKLVKENEERLLKTIESSTVSYTVNDDIVESILLEVYPKFL